MGFGVVLFSLPLAGWHNALWGFQSQVYFAVWFALAAFTLLAGVIFHNFWAVPPAEQMAQQINFLKNRVNTVRLLRKAEQEVAVRKQLNWINSLG